MQKPGHENLRKPFNSYFSLLTTMRFTDIFHCQTLQNLPKLGFFAWKYTIWQPCDWRSAWLVLVASGRVEMVCQWPYTHLVDGMRTDHWQSDTRRLDADPWRRLGWRIEIFDLHRRRALKKKRASFFQPVSNLFWVVKRGFVEPCKNVPL
jgi:hypothetical protein